MSVYMYTANEIVQFHLKSTTVKFYFKVLMGRWNISESHKLFVILLQVVSSRLDCVKKLSELSELRITAEEAVKMAKTADAEQRQIRTCFDQEVHSMRKSYEDKVYEPFSRNSNSDQLLQ